MATVKILFLTPYLSWPPDHGGRIRSCQLLSSLSPHHQVVNVTGLSSRDRLDQARTLEDQGIRVCAAALNPVFGRLGPLERLGKFCKLLVGKTSLISRFRTQELARLVAQHAQDADLCVIDHLWMTAYLPELEGLPIVLSTHNVESDVLTQRAATCERWLARMLTLREAAGLATAESDAIRRARTTIVVSSQDGVRLRNDSRDIRVIPNGVDVRAHPLLPPASFTPIRMLYVGGYDYAPNLRAARRLALEVLPLLQRRHASAELHLVGHDPEGELADLTRHRGVKVLGRVKDVMPCYGRASALVVPLDVGGGSRLKIIEAWAFGRPVVSSTVGAEGLEATEGDHLLLADTPETMVDALERLATGDDLRRRIVASARERAETRHDWGPIRRDFLRAVEDAWRTPKGNDASFNVQVNPQDGSKDRRDERAWS